MVKKRSELSSVSSSKQNSKGISKKTAWIIVGVIVLIGILVLAYFVFFVNDSVQFNVYDKNGVSVKYPSTWQVFDEGWNSTEGIKTILFTKSLLNALSGSITFSVEENINTTLEEDTQTMEASLDALEDGQVDDSSITDTTLSNLPAKRVKISSSESGVNVEIITIIATADKKRYSISSISVGGESLAGIFNEMASSLKISA